MNMRQQQTNIKPAPSFVPLQAGILQRKCACGNFTVAGGACAECAKNKSGLQRKLTIGASHDPLEREADRVANQVLSAPAHSLISGTPPRIQRFTGHSMGENGTAPASVNRVLASGGRPLEPALRQDMEQRFGYDFSRVRVHSDGAAEQSAKDVNAHAYTVGRDIVFGAGRLAPGTNEGRRLLAHELTHVAQQGDSVARNPAEISKAGEPMEDEADRVADAEIGGNETLLKRRSVYTASVARLMRTIAYDADCQPNQKEVEGNVSRAQASAARWGRAALTGLARPEDVGGLLRRHFNIEATNAAAVGRIRSHFEAIVEAFEGDALTYHCRPDSDARCHTADGGEVAGFAHPGRADIFFCDPYPFQNFFGHKSLIDTLLHEAAHAHDVSFNHDTYEWNDDYPGANPLTNADSYVSFARDASFGRSGANLNLELDVGSLFSADPQFYIAAGISKEVGGPALDLFNLKLGSRLAFLPGTSRHPARGFVAADIGLRINPIGQRVYVDVTTGAFYGANFTDIELMAGIANRISAGYRGEQVDLGLDLSHLRDFVGDKNLVIVGVRTAVRF